MTPFWQSSAFMRSSSMPIVISSGTSVPLSTNGLRLLAELGALADVLAEELAGGDVGEAGLVLETRGLSPLACAGQAQ